MSPLFRIHIKNDTLELLTPYMKSKKYIHIILLSLLFPAVALAVTEPVKNDAYTTCKNTAYAHKQKILAPAIKEYVASSQVVTDTAKKNFEKASWYIDSSWRIKSKKIQEDKKKAMIPVREKINKVRLSAENTWKAEDALCEHMYKHATTTEKKVSKKKK